MKEEKETKLWEKQPNESEPAWLAFRFFRDTEPPRKATRCGIGWSTADASTWYREHAWKDRAAAYDAHIESIRLEEREAFIRQSERDIAAGHMAFLADAREVCALELTKLLQASRDSENMGTIHTSQLIKLMETVIKYDRLVRGASTENVSQELDLSNFSPEELRALALSQIEAAKKS